MAGHFTHCVPWPDFELSKQYLLPPPSVVTVHSVPRATQPAATVLALVAPAGPVSADNTNNNVAVRIGVLVLRIVFPSSNQRDEPADITIDVIAAVFYDLKFNACRRA
jgi:hypothetical protein